MKYREWLEEWLDVYVTPYVKTRTLNQYRDIVYKRLIPDLGWVEVDELDPILLQRYIAELSQNGNTRTGQGLTPNTIYGILSVIRCSVSTAQMHGMARNFNADKIKRPRRSEKAVTCFTKEQQKLIENDVLRSGSDKMFGIVLCLYTGLRLGEVLALEWTDVDLESEELQVLKTCYDGRDDEGRYGRIVDTPKTQSSRRTVPITGQLIPYLRKLRERSSTVYVVSDGDKAPTLRSYQRSFEALQRRLGIPHHGFHALRHTFATRALECGMDVKTLSEILGHRSPTVTLNRYAHSLYDHKKEMMNKLGLLL